MAYEVRPGMRFLGKITGRVLRAISAAENEYWLAEVEGTGDRTKALFGPNCWEPIPEPAPEMCAFPGCLGSGFDPDGVHDFCLGGACSCGEKRNSIVCHPFVPQAKSEKDIPATVIPPPTNRAAIVFKPQPGQRPAWEQGPSAVAAAPSIEPWRPSVDDWDLLPDAVEGWRR